jgi:phosphoribosylamine-glycine ligase
VDKAYQQAKPISFEKMHFRKDIGYHILDAQAKIV